MVGPVIFDKITNSTLKHLGGRMTSAAALYQKAGVSADFYEAEFETNLCGRLMVGLTKKPSRAKAFAGVGCRLYFRGVARAQQELEEVKSWMGDMILITRV